ncbi:MAG: beta-N-acetylhexosaminidase [Opitutales bacterium]|nr:beta-N-acetylhexosaminidase [Opitutales bacterium]
MASAHDFSRDLHLFPRPKNLIFDPAGDFFDFSSWQKTGPLCRSDLLTKLENFKIFLLEDPDTDPEYFKISIKKNLVELFAGSNAAADWAMELLWQMILQMPSTQLPCCEIEDWPDLPIRGFMLDISRGRVPTLDEFFEILLLLHRSRYNQLQLYVEHTYAFKNHSKVWKKSSPLDPDIIRCLQEWCDAMEIELVPNLNSFGHVERWLKHKPYNDLAECPDGFYHDLAKEHRPAGTFAPTEESADFVGTLYDEYLPNFKSSWFNIGGDEPWELGMGKSKTACEAKGRRAVYVEHMLRLIKKAEAHEKTILFWADVLLEDSKETLPAAMLENTVPVIWGYEPDHPFDEQCRRVVEALPKNRKHYFLLAPGTSTWLSFSGRLTNAEINIRQACKAAKKYAAGGILLTNWGDKGYYNSFGIALPAIVFAGGNAWNIDGNDDRPDLQIALRAYLDLPREREKIAAAVDLLLQVGEIDGIFSKKMPNRSLLHRAFFASRREREDLIADVPAEECERALACGNALVKKLMAIKIEDDGEGSGNVRKLLTDIAVALAFDIQSVSLILTGKNGGKKIKNNDRRLKELFSFAWRERDCEGGLEEALSFFETRED